ncbi:demethylspheroidene O-methyltransferase [Jannaschia faecimaris]|uniref:Demethylspheroidene O-methyltransferase n=1 Tax=Jannaschia faecimaris TaxID=1244108 RepID=A0A1H3TDB4_9RHOB|nr:methyltransferase [Jannaschia faecimaris]SDZ48293.1 demethylspheroidene O-methyltransferase [Jannaschia faecimaris]
MAAVAPLRPGWTHRLIASPRFQGWAARFPLTQGLVRRDGEALFDLVAGFCHSQILSALVQFDIPDILMERPAKPAALALRCEVPEARMKVLLQGAASLGLLKRKRDGRFSLTRKGAAMVGVPGLRDMIRHHDVLYRDLADPVAFFRGDVETELAGFWPYVFGGEMGPTEAARYSRLMTESQAMVAEDTLRRVSLRGVKRLCDVGGGAGAFLTAAASANPDMALVLFDLPQVVPQATARFASAGLSARVDIVPGSFRDDSLPDGCDAISLVRVLYDHDDETIADLLSKCRTALPPGGRLIISEPMSGGDVPERAADAYFSLYTMAMRTGRTRSFAEIATLCGTAGFDVARPVRPLRPFVTSVLQASVSS